MAEEDGLLADLLQAFGHGVAAACVGPVTEEAAIRHGIAVACAPSVGRLGLLVRELSTTLRDRHLHLSGANGEVLLQGGLVVSASGRAELADRERQVLALLASRAGAVVSRTTLEREIWGSLGERGALDAVLSRLRRHLHPTGLTITTRVRRGYQLEAQRLGCDLRTSVQPALVAS
jgi:uroporphyrinogen-III synthase